MGEPFHLAKDPVDPDKGTTLTYTLEDGDNDSEDFGLFFDPSDHGGRGHR